MSVLVESFFLDNKKDKEIGDTVSEQRAFGVAYAKAILEYLGIAYKPNTVSTSDDTVYRVQVGAYRNKDNASGMKEKLEKEGFEAIIVKA